jgi:hypothetical protein
MGHINIDNLLTLAPREFEELIRTLLTKMQFNASVTKISGDGGIDIIALSEQPIVGGRYVIQCKKYSPGNNVGEPLVRELYGAMMHENANKGILITTSDFTKQAISFSQNKAIELINGNDIINLLNKYITKTEDDKKQFFQNTSNNLFERWTTSNTVNAKLERNKEESYIKTTEQSEIKKTAQDFKQEQLQTIRQAINIRFISYDLTIRDKETELVWAKQANMGGCMTWNSVLEYISMINANMYAGRSDWRLPTLDEFKTIIEFATRWKGYEINISSLMNIMGFRNVQNAYYWTSTGDSSTYLISMIDGNTYAYNRSYNYGYNMLPVIDGIINFYL